MLQNAAGKTEKNNIAKKLISVIWTWLIFFINNF